MKVTENEVWYIWNIMVDDHEDMNKTDYHDDEETKNKQDE